MIKIKQEIFKKSLTDADSKNAPYAKKLYENWKLYIHILRCVDAKLKMRIYI